MTIITIIIIIITIIAIILEIPLAQDDHHRKNQQIKCQDEKFLSCLARNDQF